MVALQDIEPSVHKKKLRLNGLSIEKKPQFINCDSIGKRQKPNSPVGGTFKNQLKHLSDKITDGCKIRDGAEESHGNDQVLTSDINVKFSYKDEIVGLKKRTSFDETINYGHIALDIDKDRREEFCPITESKQFSSTLEQVTRPDFLKPCINQEKSNQLEQKSELLTKIAVYDNNNSQLFDGGNTTTVHFSPNAGISKPLPAAQERQMCGKNTQVRESGVFSFGGKFIDYSEDHTFQVDDVNKNASTETFLELSSSYSAPYDKVNERPKSPSPSSSYYGDNVFPADMTDKSYPFTRWGQGCIRNSCLDPNFFDLPLNSHGELINFSSSGNLMTNQLETSSPLGEPYALQKPITLYVQTLIPLLLLLLYMWSDTCSSSETVVLNMSMLAWSAVTFVQGCVPVASEGLSLVVSSNDGEDVLVSFGGYNGRYNNEVYILKPSHKSTLQSKINENSIPDSGSTVPNATNATRDSEPELGAD
ncbi:hypothetical protein KIW84_046296 [Lathyrus oleraceus]|uniref:Uncharacterized protein n=1 Tax=Pisum sativum TaxID=3888 RepID=A0A9D4XMQ7_PEA|nr:hypothetical protein KIW84_046296 [Pisum sativum]